MRIPADLTKTRANTHTHIRNPNFRMRDYNLCLEATRRACAAVKEKVYMLAALPTAGRDVAKYVGKRGISLPS